MEITKMSSKGQIVIPSKMREDLGIIEGSIIAIEEMNDVIVIKKIDKELVNQFNKSLNDVRLGKIKRLA